MSDRRALRIGPWQPDTPRPSDAEHVKGCWTMADLAAKQHPMAVRALWRDTAEGSEPLALGGVVDIGGDGLAFVWKNDAVPQIAWRHALPALRIGIASCHERGLRRIFAVVAARYAKAVQLVKLLGFEFFADDSGWPQTDEPMLRYLHAWPPLDEPPLVRHQRHELERACLASWCPQLLEEAA